jgi:uncharacterized protein YjiS (DUF1127 family)
MPKPETMSMLRAVVENHSRETTHIRQPARQGGTHVVRSAVKWLIKEWKVQKTLEHLSELDDHMLRDIGLTRSEIETVVRHGRRAEALWR